MALPDSNTVIEWETHRGRQADLNRTEAGTSRILLLNRDGLYDPTNLGSPYFGTVLPFKQAKINVAHPITGVFRDIFSGYIESWNFTRQGPRGSQVELNLMDGFELLENAHVVPDGAQAGGAAFYASQRVDDRMKALLADAGWPLARTNIYTGSINVQDITYGIGTSFLSALMDTADAEFPGIANCFCGKSGFFNFRGRYDRLNYTGYPRNTWFCGDDGAIELDDTLIPIFDMSYNMDKQSVINTSLVTPLGIPDVNVPAQRKTDGTSVGLYGERANDVQNLIILDNWRDSISGEADCERFAQYYVDNYKVPLMRIDSIEFHAQMAGVEDTPINNTIWDFFHKVEIGDVVSIQTFHPGGGGFDGALFFVEGIHNVVKGLNDLIPDWTMTLDLSPLDLFATWGGDFPATGIDDPT